MSLSPLQLPSSSSSMRSTYRLEFSRHGMPPGHSELDCAPNWAMPISLATAVPVQTRRAPAAAAPTAACAPVIPSSAPSAFHRPLTRPSTTPEHIQDTPAWNDQMSTCPRTLPSVLDSPPTVLALPPIPAVSSVPLPKASTFASSSNISATTSTRPRPNHHRRRSSASSMASAASQTPLFVHANGTRMRVYVCPRLPRKISRAVERYGGSIVPIHDALVHVVPHPPRSQASDIDPDALVVSVRWVYAVVKKRAMADLKAFAVEYVPDWAAWDGSEACTPESERVRDDLSVQPE